MRLARALAATLLLAGSGASAPAGAQQSTCVSCHAAEEDEELALPVSEWRDSVHALHEVSCDGCHGGDPNEEDADASMSEKAGFLELPAWTGMAEHCGACHELLAFEFERGRFGRMQEEGARVATCGTCHMPEGHRIRAARPDDLLATARCRECLPLRYPTEKLQLLTEVHERQQGLREALRRIAGKGMNVRGLVAELDTSAELYARAVHRFDDGIVAATAFAQQKIDALEATAAAYDREADRRRRHGVALLGMLGLLLLSLLLYRRLLP